MEQKQNVHETKKASFRNNTPVEINDSFFIAFNTFKFKCFLIAKRSSWEVAYEN